MRRRRMRPGRTLSETSGVAACDTRGFFNNRHNRLNRTKFTG
jgi:hypothetical protein